MAGNAPMPSFLLACTNQASDGKHANEAVTESEKIAALLLPFEKNKGGNIVEARYGSRRYFTDVITQKKHKNSVELVHILSGNEEEPNLRFRTRSGESTLSAVELAKSLRSFPNLKLIILSGEIHPDYSEKLVSSGTAPVLFFPSGERSASVLFYDALLDGVSILEAYQRMAKQYGKPFVDHHRILAPSRQGWLWSEETAKPCGMWLDQGVESFLNYHLIDSSKIPAEERLALNFVKPKAKQEPSKTRNPRKPKPAQRPKRKQESTKTEAKAKPNPAQRPRPADVENRRESVRAQHERLNPDPEEQQNSKRRWLWITAAVFSLGLGLFLSFPLWQDWFGGTEQACLFPQDDEYHILILPFSNQENCVDESIEKRQLLIQQLEDIQQKGFRFTSRFYDLRACEHTESALSLMAENCDANLVLWAYPEDHDHTGEKMLTFEFIADESQAPNPFISNNIQIPFYEARGDVLSQPVENVMFWALAQKSLREKRYQEAIAEYRRIETPDGPLQTLLMSQMAQAYRLDGNYDEARKLYDELVILHPEENRYLYERANLLTKLGVYDSALYDYGMVLDAEPDNVNALISRGVLYREQGDYQSALRDFNQVLKANPDFSPVYCSRAEVYEALKQYSPALADYNQALRVSPDYVGALYGRARLKHKIGRKKEALADISRALTLEPDYTDALLFQGDILLDDREYNDALVAYTQVLTNYKSARAYYKRGHVYRLLREYQTAIEDLRNATKQDPTLAIAWRELGLAHAGLEQEYEAFEFLNKAIQLAPTDAESYYVRADLYNKLEREEEALADYKKALTIRPRNAVAHYKQGELFFKQEKYKQALEAINQALRLNPQQSDALVVRGKVYQALNNPAQALKDWKQALRIDPKQAEAYYLQGAYQLKQGRLSTARGNLDRAIQLNTDAYEAYVLRAELYSEEKDYIRALELYSEALRINPKQPEVYYIRAKYHLKLQQNAKALADYNQAISLSPPEDVNIYLQRAIAASQLKAPDYNSALIDLSKVIRTYPDSFRAYCVRSLLYQQMGRPSKASEDIKQAIKIGKNDAMPYVYKGILQERLGEDTSAIVAYTRAIFLDDDYAEAYIRRGNLLSRREQYNVALDDLNFALKLDPTQADAYMHRGDLYRRIGRYRQAIDDFSQALRYAPGKDEAYYKRGRIYALNDEYEPAIDDIKRSLEINPDIGIRYAQLAKIYARMGQRDLMYEYLQLSLERDFPAVELRSEPSFKPYQHENRFKELQRAFD
ncbi:MAG: tetratricopeptide repeat protein [Bacteroidota bacterium]